MRIIKDHPLTGVGPDMVIQVYPHYRDTTARQPAEPAPAQRAAADRGRARPAGAGGVAVVHRRRWCAISSAGGASRAARRCRPPALAVRRRDAGRRHVRIQFRRLRVPDAVPGPGHAARTRPSAAPSRLPRRCRMSAAPTDLPALLDRARGRAVLVVGDLMLDHFVIGRVDRISPEAPVPVVRFDHESFRLGGAANVAHNVAALGGTRRDRRRGRRRRRRHAAARRPARARAIGTRRVVADRRAARRASCAW